MEIQKTQECLIEELQQKNKLLEQQNRNLKLKIISTASPGPMVNESNRSLLEQTKRNHDVIQQLQDELLWAKAEAMETKTLLEAEQLARLKVEAEKRQEAQKYKAELTSAQKLLRSQTELWELKASQSEQQIQQLQQQLAEQIELVALCQLQMESSQVNLDVEEQGVQARFLSSQICQAEQTAQIEELMNQNSYLQTQLQRVSEELTALKARIPPEPTPFQIQIAEILKSQRLVESSMQPEMKIEDLKISPRKVPARNLKQMQHMKRTTSPVVRASKPSQTAALADVIVRRIADDKRK